MTADAPKVVVFDVNETLSDMSPLRRRFSDVGAPELTATLWFASLLRDGFALTAAGGFERFTAIAESTLRTVLADMSLTSGLDEAVTHVMEGFADLDVKPDVPDGVRRLHRAGIRLVTLTNGSIEITERLLDRAGIRSELEQLLSVESTGAWKPAARSYQYAARVCAVPVGQMLLVAVHPWDVDGAARAGLRTAWVNRSGRSYPRHFTPPELVVTGLTEVAEELGVPPAQV